MLYELVRASVSQIILDRPSAKTIETLSQACPSSGKRAAIDSSGSLF
jgi:hypothetical protein